MSTISASTTTTNAYVVTADTTGTLVLQTGATPTTAVTIDTSQNVGLGTTSPTGKFEVSSTSALTTSSITSTASQAINQGGQIYFRGAYTSTTPTELASMYGAKENSTDGNYAGYFAITTRPNGGSLTERMRIDSSGNVGIGASSPVGKFDVYTAAGGSSYFRDATVSSLIGTDTSTAYYGTSGAYPVRFITNNTEKMRVDSSGNFYVEAGNTWQYAPAPTAMAAGANAITAAQLAGGLFNGTGATAVTMTLPLATALDTYFASVPTTNISFDFVVVNTGTSTGIVTVTMNTGITSLGVMTVPITTSAQFRLRRTAANTYICYRI